MMMTDAEKAATEVILGVWTRTSMCPRGGGLGPSWQTPLGELSVPTTVKGYESLVHWAKGFGAP